MTASDTKDILLTGASGAIGGAMAHHLAAAGFRMHLTSREPDRLKSLVADISKNKDDVHTYALDLVDLKQGRQVVEAFFKKASHPFGLICNAGDHGVLGSFIENSFEEWAKSLQQNFLGHAAMIHAFGRQFAECLAGNLAADNALPVLGFDSGILQNLLFSR